MKFIIKEEQLEDEIELSLEPWKIGVKEKGNYESIVLMGKNNDGTKQVIMNFKNGKFTRNTISPLRGIKSNDNGQIIEEEEEEK